MFNSGNNKTPVRVDVGKSIDTVPPEVVTFKTTAGATDSGEAAGTIVYGQLARSPVLSLMGDREGEYTGNALSTSISFTTGVMDSTKEVGFVYSANENDRFTLTAAKLTEDGQWACDYFTGLLIIRKKTAGTSQTITSYKARSSGVTLNPGSISIGEVQSAAATTTSSGTQAVDTTAGGTQVVAANVNRYFTQCQNNGSVDVYFGTGTVTSSFLKVAAGVAFSWHSQEALKVLSSSGSVNIAYTDYINS